MSPSQPPPARQPRGREAAEVRGGRREGSQGPEKGMGTTDRNDQLPRLNRDAPSLVNCSLANDVRGSFNWRPRCPLAALSCGLSFHPRKALDGLTC